MKKLIALLLGSALVNACATTDLPLKADLVRSSSGDKNVYITGEKIEDYSDEYNVLLQINLQNKGGSWVRIDSAELDLANADGQPYNIVVGKDLLTWGEAKAEEKKMKDHNEEMSVAGVMLGGGALALAGILSKDKTLTALGTATYAGGAAWSVVNEFSAKKMNAQGVKAVPETHLYAPLTIPSMTLIKRWVLINVPSGRISRIAKLKLKTVEGDVLEYNLDLLGKK